MYYNKKETIARNQKMIMIFLVFIIFVSVYFFITLSEELYPKYDIIPDENKTVLGIKLPDWIKIVNDKDGKIAIDSQNSFKIRLNKDWSIFSADKDTMAVGLFKAGQYQQNQGFKVGVYKDNSSTTLAVWVKDWVVKSECPACYSSPKKLEDNLYSVINKDQTTTSSEIVNYFLNKDGKVFQISVFGKEININEILGRMEFFAKK